MGLGPHFKNAALEHFFCSVLSHSRGIPLPRYTRHIIEFENHATTPLIIHLKCAYMKTWQLREVKISLEQRGQTQLLYD